MAFVAKKPYNGKYPSAADFLFREGLTSRPRQRERIFTRTSGVDIIYTLKGMTPAKFREHSDTLLLLAFQEASRYSEYKWKFAKFEVKMGRLKRGRDVPDIATFQAAMHDDPDIMVYGPGYETPQKFFLIDKVDDILDISKRYQGKVDRQNPYKVLQLVISIREEIQWE